MGATELNLEKIVSLKPDLILGINSYIDETGYRDLSSIAPTVAELAGVLPGATTSEEQTRITGKALGREDRAQELVARRGSSSTTRSANIPNSPGSRRASCSG
ncbi:ABC transporter substrate-binding protein [Nocardia puris]|nr:ABC transporter substrate-binding protein [Nocardia puris]